MQEVRTLTVWPATVTEPGTTSGVVVSASPSMWGRVQPADRLSRPFDSFIRTSMWMVSPRASATTGPARAAVAVQARYPVYPSTRATSLRENFEEAG